MACLSDCCDSSHLVHLFRQMFVASIRPIGFIAAAIADGVTPTEVLLPDVGTSLGLLVCIKTFGFTQNRPQRF